MMLFRQIEIPSELPILLTFQMDRRALVFSFAVAVVSAVIFGLVPAIQASRTDLTAVIKTGDVAAPGRRRLGRAVLTTVQVAASVVLLVVAMFIYRGFREQLANGPGYRTDQLLMMGFDTSLIRYSEEQAEQFFDQVAERARAVAGVQTVSMTTSIPMLNDSIGTVTIAPEGFAFPPGKEDASTLAARVDEYYFDAMGIALVRGRNFTRRDDDTAPRVAIVNQHLADHYWPNQDPLGKRFRLKSADNAWVAIVGVARTSKYIFVAEPPTDYVYLPYRQNPFGSMFLLARSAADPASLAAPLREMVRGLDVNMPIFNVRTMEELYRIRAVSIFNVLVTTVGAMGLMGLGLSIVGLYGLVAYAASRRTREIGIRMAIGATAPSVLRMVLRHGLTLALTGLALGLAASVGAGELLSAAFPSGDDRRDLMSLFLIAPVVLIATLLAVSIPAVRASRVNPVVALRHE
jgi:predicted permease